MTSFLAKTQVANMQSFKSFLTEATTGKAKWEKYFADDEHVTKIKSDSPLYDIHGKAIPKLTISKGEQVTVPVEKTYNPKMLIVWNGEEYRVSIAAVDKPIAVADKLQLKPDFFEITGEFKASSYKKEILRLVSSHADLDQPLKDYLVELIKHAFGEKNSAELKDAHDAIAGTAKILNTINKDFLEIIGPVVAHDELGLPDSVKYYFPEAGNEPLYDFKILDGDTEYLFSSKSAKAANTNTLKTAEIFKKVEGEKKFKHRKQELKVLEIISSTSIKATPAALAKFIEEEFGKIIEVPDSKDLAALCKAEREIVDFINSKLDFVDMINHSLPQLWFIKLKINNKGEVDGHDVSHGREIKKAKLRTKNSPGHFVDRIGFQI